VDLAGALEEVKKRQRVEFLEFGEFHGMALVSDDRS
jgi:hypothetical protein